MLDTNPSPNDTAMDDDIPAVAIVGMALRVPGAQSLEQFWSNLREGVESTTFFSDEQLRAAGVSEATLRDPSYVKAFGVLEDVDLFDPGFFDMPPREAEILDPQHRQLLACSWEALEHAGYAPASPGFEAAGRVGMMGGVGLNSYLLNNLMGRNDLIESLGGWQITLGNDKDFAATRVAYKLDLRGAALNVSTACSTSLVATAMGCQSLLSYQCDMIVAGGCSIHTPQDQGYWHHSGGTLSPDGRCRAFDTKAQGTLDGNGVAVVVLKRLDDAIRDGDTIHAVIRGFAVNNDGGLKVGYTAPSVEGQAAVIREAQEMAEISADTIGYVETHGTGTDLGDLVEISALSEAFRRAGVTQKQQCGIGSLKTNVGHLDTAAGAASLIKTVLGLSNKQIPPSLHFTEPNPKLGLESSPFYVNAALRDWPRLRGAPRRAGVSSFGIGGTNAHLVIEEAPVVAPAMPGRPWQVLPVSARSEAALSQNAGRLAAYLGQHTELPLADVAYTLQLGRRAFTHRRVVLADTHAATELGSIPCERIFSGEVPQHTSSVVLMFPGQDAQHADMARTLYRDEPLFRREIDQCSASLRRLHGIDLQARLFGRDAVTDPGFATDPLPIFVIEYALARTWMALGVQPRAMIGYSMGEYACACLSGVISLDDALTLAVESQRLLSTLEPGALLAVSLAEEDLRPLLGTELDLVMVSAPRQCVVGGRPEAIAALKPVLTAKGAVFVPIGMGLPFHTRYMEPFLTRYRARLQQIRFHTPAIPYVSCVTGDWIRPEQATDPEHYLRLAGATVKLAQGFEQLFSLADAIYLEAGPGQVMSNFLLLQKGRPANVLSLSTLQDPRVQATGKAAQGTTTDLLSFQAAMARLWTNGIDIKWSALYVDERRRRVPLPTYAFERQRYWIEPKRVTAAPEASTTKLGKHDEPEKWFYLPTWRELLPKSREPISGRWLVVGDESGLAPSLAEGLRLAGGDVTLRYRSGAMAIDCSHASGWDSLFDSVTATGAPFDHIVYLGVLDHDGNDDDATLLNVGFYSILALGQALGRRVFSESVTVSLVTTGVLSAGDVSVSPAKAAVLGPLHVLPQEYPNLHCRIVDVIAPSLPWQRTRLVETLVDELANEDKAVALRAGSRWVESFVPYPIAAAETGKGGLHRLRAGGVYLITGGLGNIGLAFADTIARRAPGAHLVLTGRQAPHALSIERSNKVKALEALGAKVHVMMADGTDEQAMQILVTETEARYGKLNGVILAAGIVGQASFATVGESSPAFCTTQIAPKLQGARVLERVLADRPLDFCMLCSSLSPILGGLGFAAYAAANACLDAFAVDHNRRHPTQWISVNWEGWRFEETIDANQTGAAVAELGLLPSEGIEAFERILAAPHSDRIVLSTGDLENRIRQWVQMEMPATVAPQSHHARPSMLGAYVAPAGTTAISVARLWEQLLGIDGISANDSFFELGGNSLLLTQLLAQIRKTFHLDLSLTSLFERPTIAQIAALIEVTRQALLAGTADVEDEYEREEGFL